MNYIWVISMACWVSALFTPAVNGQLGGPPVERSGLSLSLISLPLSADEAAATTDIQALLLKGPVRGVVYRFSNSRPNLQGPTADDRTRSVRFDACGNVTRDTTELDFAKRAGRSELTVVQENDYLNETCMRSSAARSVNADANEPLRFSWQYDADGKPLRYTSKSTDVRMEWRGDTLEKCVIGGSGYTRDTEYGFDAETGRLSSIEFLDTRLRVRWESERSLEVYWLDRSNSPYRYRLDQHENIVHEVGPSGHSWTREYTYDDRGNWTRMLRKDADGVPGQLVEREIDYGDSE